jgi:hypothetical protein
MRKNAMKDITANLCLDAGVAIGARSHIDLHRYHLFDNHVLCYGT